MQGGRDGKNKTEYINRNDSSKNSRNNGSFHEQKEKEARIREPFRPSCCSLATVQNSRGFLGDAIHPHKSCKELELELELVLEVERHLAISEVDKLV